MPHMFFSIMIVVRHIHSENISTKDTNKQKSTFFFMLDGAFIFKRFSKFILTILNGFEICADAIGRPAKQI